MQSLNLCRLHNSSSLVDGFSSHHHNEVIETRSEAPLEKVASECSSPINPPAPSSLSFGRTQFKTSSRINIYSTTIHILFAPKSEQRLFEICRSPEGREMKGPQQTRQNQGMIVITPTQSPIYMTCCFVKMLLEVVEHIPLSVSLSL